MTHPIRKHAMKLKGHHIKTSTGFHPHSKLGHAIKGMGRSFMPKFKGTSVSSEGMGVVSHSKPSHKRIKPLKFNF